MIAAILQVTKTPLLPRADGKGGVFDIRGISADGGQSVVGNIISDGTSEADGLTVIDRRNVYDASLELVTALSYRLKRMGTINKKDRVAKTVTLSPFILMGC